MTSAAAAAPAPARRSAPAGRRILAQTRVELVLTLRRGESVLLTFLIPIVLLAFFSLVDVLPSERGVDEAIDFLAPGILALAIMSTAMVSLAIATGFERQMGVLRRLGATPLTRRDLLAAKIIAVVAIETIQVVILVVEAVILGWRPSGGGLATALVALLLGTIGFAGLGMLMAGTLPALTTLAAANGLYIVLLLLGGMIIPLSRLPEGIRAVALILPAGALSDVVQGAFLHDQASVRSWLVLIAWAIIAPAVAAWRFRWD